MLRTVLLTVAGANLRKRMMEWRRAAVFGAVAGVAMLIGVLFLLLAAFIFAAERYGALEAALGFGAGFVVLAALVHLVGRLRTGSGALRTQQEERAELVKSVATAAAIGAAPVVIRSLGTVGSIVLPIVAVAAYAIYRENRPPPSPGGGEPL